MAKYSTGGSSESDPNSEDASCSLCGETEGSFTTENVAGAEVTVCRSCSSNHTDKSSSNTNENTDETNQTNYNKTSESETSGYTITNPDSSWVEENRPDYGNAETPYLVPNYVNKINESLDSSDLTVENIAEKTGLNEDTINAVLDGNAVSAGVSARAIGAIEECLEVKIQEEV